MEISVRIEIGFTQRSPSVRIVPEYRPRTCSTRARPGETGVSPAATISPAMNSTTATTTRAMYSPLTPTMNSAIPAASNTSVTPSNGHPFRSPADRSVTFGLGISTITSASALIVRLLRGSLSRR